MLHKSHSDSRRVRVARLCCVAVGGAVPSSRGFDALSASPVVSKECRRMHACLPLSIANATQRLVAAFGHHGALLCRPPGCAYGAAGACCSAREHRACTCLVSPPCAIIATCCAPRCAIWRALCCARCCACPSVLSAATGRRKCVVSGPATRTSQGLIDVERQGMAPATVSRDACALSEAVRPL